jgi:hypothetical protein
MLITINAFPIFIWLILIIINEHQTADCIYRVYTDEDVLMCKGIMDDYGYALSYVILIVTWVFLYFYTTFIKKWKALPE